MKIIFEFVIINNVVIVYILGVFKMILDRVHRFILRKWIEGIKIEI